MHATRPFPVLFAIVLSCLVASCATVPKPQIYTLHPVSDSTVRWYRGEAGIVQSARGLETEVTPSGSITDLIYCNVRIVNTSPDTVTVDPLQFCYLHAGTGATVDNVAITAINPETRIRDYELAMEEEDRRYVGEQNTKVAVALIGAAVTVAALLIDSDSHHDHSNNCDNSSNNSSGSDYDEQQHYNKMADLRSAKRYWEESALRKTTLYPGESIEGPVVFPMSPNAQFISIHFSVDGDTAVFPFRVNRVQ